MTGLFAHIFSAHPCGETVTASQRPGLRDCQCVNARGGDDKDLSKPGNVTTFIRFQRRVGLLSRRVRDAFAAEAAQDPAGDYPPASDCWPMVPGDDELAFHVPAYVGRSTLPSPGKSSHFTAPASEGGEPASRTYTGGCSPQVVRGTAEEVHRG